MSESELFMDTTIRSIPESTVLPEAAKHHKPSFGNGIVLAASVAFLVFIWGRNFNLLGSFFDYSILTSAVGHIQAGLLPYRDFTTPLQSLTIYLCYLAEMIFGRRYLALSYANLVVGFATYALVMKMLGQRLSFYLRILVTTAFCACTFFQHGILWYNSVAMALLTFTCLQAVRVFHKPQIDFSDGLKLCALVFLSSMNKLNFHALGMATVVMVLSLRWWRRRDHFRLTLMTLSAVIFSGIILGPVVETVVNHTTLHNFAKNVFGAAGGRGTGLFYFLNPYLYLGVIQDFYPDNWSSGLYLIGFCAYLCCLCAAMSRANDSTEEVADGKSFARWMSSAALLYVLVASMLLTTTNMEIEILTSSLLLVGLVCVFSLTGEQLPQSAQTVFKSTILFLGVFFLIAGGSSAFMHSRVRYTETPWSAMMIRAFHDQRKLSALKNAVPFFETTTISPEFGPYLSGVQVTEPSQKKLSKVAAFMAQTHGSADASDIYWGPGLEILNRVYTNRLQGRLPLWYHLKVTVRDQDVPGIIEELQRSRYQWFVASDSIVHLPDDLLDYFKNNYERVEKDEIVVYHRIH